MSGLVLLRPSSKQFDLAWHAWLFHRYSFTVDIDTFSSSFFLSASCSVCKSSLNLMKSLFVPSIFLTAVLVAQATLLVLMVQSRHAYNVGSTPLDQNGISGKVSGIRTTLIQDTVVRKLKAYGLDRPWIVIKLWFRFHQVCNLNGADSTTRIWNIDYQFASVAWVTFQYRSAWIR